MCSQHMTENKLKNVFGTNKKKIEFYASHYIDGELPVAYWNLCTL